MSIFTKTIFAAAASLSLSAAALASDFEATCAERMAERHPDRANPEEICACMAESADEATLEELASASGPEDLGDAAQAVYKSCGMGG